MPFEVASAPAMFQKLMDTLLQGVPQVVCYIDDILVTGGTEGEHLSNLEEVLNRLKRHNVQIRKEKCVFLASSVDFLGHRIDKQGLHPLPSKVDAIVNAPVPKTEGIFGISEQLFIICPHIWHLLINFFKKVESGYRMKHMLRHLVRLNSYGVLLMYWYITTHSCH